jgi:hypothetical protein
MSRGNRRAVLLVVFCVALALVVSRCDYFTRQPYQPPTPFIIEGR